MSGVTSALQSTAGPGAKRAERQCQTVEVKQRSAQTCREAHVQMARPDLLLDTSRDKILAASMPPVPVNSVLSSLHQKLRCMLAQSLSTMTTTPGCSRDQAFQLTADLLMACTRQVGPVLMQLILGLLLANLL